MTREDADALWGPDVVDRALGDDHPEPLSRELTQELSRRIKTLPPGAFRAWTLVQPWPRFCTIVAILSGSLREELDHIADFQDEDSGDE